METLKPEYHKTIFYSICGEGLGHCSRALTLIKHMPLYKFYLFVGSDNSTKFAADTGLPNLTVIKIDGIKFVSSNNKINLFKTICGVIGFIRHGYYYNTIFFQKLMNRIRPDLVLVDWEPSLARFCYNNNIDYISIDSQHKFRFSKLKYSIFLKIYHICASLLSRFYIPNPIHNIISTFQSPLIIENKHVTAVNCLVDTIVVESENTFEKDSFQEDFVLIYCNYSDITAKIIRLLLENKQKIVCYGNCDIMHCDVIYKKQNKKEFMKDLQSCKAVFSTAGVQIVGESAYYGKPIFVIPLPKQYEQYINGRDVGFLNLGVYCDFDKITASDVDKFLRKYPFGVIPTCNGLDKTIRLLENYVK